jgi:hypothetical protein
MRSIFIIGLVLLLVSLVCLVQDVIAQAPVKYKSNEYSDFFFYNIKACSEEKSYDNEPDSIDFSQSGNSLEFVQVFNNYCNTDENNLKLEYSLSDKVIEIREIFNTDGVAKCVCPIHIEGQIKNLEKGKYRIKFIFDNRYLGQIKIIDEREINLE